MVNGGEKTREAYIFLPCFNLNREKAAAHIKPDGMLYAAVDSGVYTAEIFGISPDYFIGDFDSSGADYVAEKYGREKILRFPPEKNDTDFMLALKFAAERGAEKITVVGGLGGRADHMLSAVFSLKYLGLRGINGVITDGCNKITYIKNSSLRVERGCRYISLIPCSPSASGVTLTNFKYPLDNAELLMEYPYAVSNELSVGAEYGIVEVVCGEILVCECDDWFAFCKNTSDSALEYL